jgi:precorrin-8X/cobalt-precorrin-8 methylmutase
VPERRLFDRYVFADWSASATPKRGTDSIWLAQGTSDHTGAPLNPGTRDEAVAELRRLLATAIGAGERVLVGADFPYGYPAGFASALRLDSSEPPWRATWAFLREFIDEGPANANRRFANAAELNRRLGSPPGPFWGHPPGFTDPALGWRVRFPFRAAAGHELRQGRHTERWLRNVKRTPSPVWKLAGQGAAGSQALLGIRRLAALRDDPLLASFSLVWPFETGFGVGAVPAGGPFVLHAEVWPGTFALDRSAHAVLDACQVLGLVEWARGLDAKGLLGGAFAAPPDLDADSLAECVQEEGWILGAATATPRVRARS